MIQNKILSGVGRGGLLVAVNQQQAALIGRHQQEGIGAPFETPRCCDQSSVGSGEWLTPAWRNRCAFRIPGRRWTPATNQRQDLLIGRHQQRGRGIRGHRWILVIQSKISVRKGGRDFLVAITQRQTVLIGQCQHRGKGPPFEHQNLTGWRQPISVRFC